MYCSRCGKEIDEKETICPHCGNPLQVFYDQYGDEEKIKKTASDALFGARILGILSIVLCFFLPILGYICGGIGYSRAKDWIYSDFYEEAKKAKLLNVIGLIVTTLVFLGYFFITFSSFKNFGFF